MTSVKNKTVFITGATSGIGLATAQLLLSKGFNVVIYSLDIPKKNPEIKTLKLNGRVLIAKGDIRSQKSVRRAMNSAVKKFGSLDVLINNAAVAQSKEFYKTTPKDWDFIFDIDIYGTLNVTHEALTIMKKQRSGMIVNIASGAGEYGIENLSLYSMAKAMIINFAQSLADEVKRDRISVLAIAPGSTATGMFKKLFPGQKAYHTPQQVAEVIAKAIEGTIAPDNRLIVDVFHHIK
jgi:3-oxoacyl-[acyl-carrier protein] reductase